VSGLPQAARLGLADLRHRLHRHHRPDTEDEQARVRVVINSVIFAYLVYLDYADLPLPTPPARLYTVFGGFYLLSVVLWVRVVLAPDVSILRRYASMLLDLSVVTYLMLACGHYGVIFYVLYLWITVGYGIRYGIRYLFAAMGVSVIGFLSVLYGSPYWLERLDVGYAMVLPLVLVPVYTAILLSKLTEAKTRAERASRVKSQFLAMVSHEIRTPLNGVLGTAQLLLRGPLEPEQRDAVRTIYRSGSVLLGLIDNILDVSKIEAGRMVLRREAVDLYEVLVSSYKLFAAQAAERRITFRLELDPGLPRRIVGDGVRLKQVLNNLIGNAVKFTHEGRVTVRAQAAGTFPEPVLRVSVDDTGIGMDAATRARIFDPFVQGEDAGGRRFGGTGLGTTIARELVELMGGRMDVHSRPGQGSRFWFEIPLERGQGPAETGRLEGARFLFVGAGGGEGEGLAGLIRARGGRVTVAAAVPDAGGAGAVDVLVMDRRAPAAGGGAGEWPVIQLGAPEAQLFLERGPSGVRWGLSAPPETGGAALEALWAFREVVRDEAPEAEGAGAAPAAGPARRLSVLVVDDNETNRRLLIQAVRALGHDADPALNGEHALQLLEQGRYDLVFMDVQMPVMGGLEATQIYRLSDVGRSGRCRIIALTADVTGDIEQRCRQAGMDGYLSKPVDLTLLAAVLEETAPGEAGGGAARRPAPAGPEPILEGDALARLLELGDAAFVQELLQTFLDEAAGQLQALETAAAAGGWHAFRQTLHALKGSAAHVGAAGVQRICEQVEPLADGELHRRAADIQADLRRSLAGLEGELAHWLEGRDCAA